MRPVSACLAVVATICATGTAAGQSTGSLPIDTISSAAIRAATTDSAYLSPWVATIPDHATIPSPRDFLGYVVGTPGELTSVDRIHAYFNTLAAASPRVKTFVLGQSEEGRDMIVAAIGDETLLNRLEDHKAMLRRLADPRITTRSQADSIIAGAVPIYWMTAGLHSTELGPPEMVMELAYRLAVEDREPFETIRHNVITLITPVLEVDGRTRQVEWYRRHVAGYTDRNNMPPRSPPFWGHYTFHDNNRDGIMVSQP
ncbi:MAG: M14 family zinc carboxypeptidase, partial [Gemmatimonadales bacterium]